MPKLYPYLYEGKAGGRRDLEREKEPKVRDEGPLGVLYTLAYPMSISG